MFLESLNQELSLKVKLLHDRAHMLRSVRNFFYERHVLEVDTPLLSKRACVDAYIDLMSTEACKGEVAYLHSSPEYAMKKLLSLGAPDIYQLSHVFRMGENGPKHQPEFMMIEWYRKGFSLDQLIDETVCLIELFFGEASVETWTYEKLFEHYLHFNPLTAPSDEICSKAIALGLQETSCSTTALFFLWDHIESLLNPHIVTIVKDFPASQASLSKIYEKNNQQYARRFEIYSGGLELANGFDELLDAKEQHRRLLLESAKRQSLGKSSLPLDEAFIAALERGIPECSGVAVGFDRLMMLRHPQASIQDVVSLPY